MSRYWRWYNRLREPWRMLVCLAMVGPLCLAGALPLWGGIFGILATLFLMYSKMGHDGAIQ